MAIANAARELVQLRDNWLNPRAVDGGRGEAFALAAVSTVADASANASPQRDAQRKMERERTLTNLYNQNPQWLQNAYRKLDDAVLDAYGWSRDLSADEILEKLLALNLERAWTRDLTSFERVCSQYSNRALCRARAT